MGAVRMWVQTADKNTHNPEVIHMITMQRKAAVFNICNKQIHS